MPPEISISAPGWRWLVALVTTAVVAPWFSIGGFFILASLFTTDTKLTETLIERLTLFYLLGGLPSVLATGAFAVWHRSKGRLVSHWERTKVSFFLASIACVFGTAAAIVLKNFVFAVPSTPQSVAMVVYLEIMISLVSTVPVLLACCLSAGPAGAYLFVKLLHGPFQAPKPPQRPTSNEAT